MLNFPLHLLWLYGVYVDYTKHNKFSIYNTKAKPHGTHKHVEKVLRFYAFKGVRIYIWLHRMWCVFANPVYYVYEYKYV